ncbi:protein YIPF5 isoform X2 [Atheta coriaria]|uniref:protein YIPF5 isoform X2 n=1 Tax=Dalotia coriaria TaxID=877792 RepID=UPI0031F3A594
MSNYNEQYQFQQQQQPQQQDYWMHDPNQYAGFEQGQADSSYNFEMPVQQDFGKELDFQTFDANVGNVQQSADMYGANPYLNGADAGYYQPGPAAAGDKFEDFEDEPPLLEELGINPDFILQKTLTVLNPFRSAEAAAMQDTDFAGPLVFCLTFGAFLLLSGKVHFSYIYGIGVMGCVGMWALLSLMSTSGVALGTVITVLGYCILPMVGLSGVNVVLSLQGYTGIVLTSIAIGWCSLSASKLFVTALSMDHQQPLVMYPCALLYGVFALITIF